LHFLHGQTFQHCCPRLGVDKGAFFHSVYRIEERLGRVYYEARRPLYPVGAYLLDNGAAKRESLHAVNAMRRRRGYRDED
jgi:hypothetical protein